MSKDSLPGQNVNQKQHGVVIYFSHYRLELMGDK